MANRGESNISSSARGTPFGICGSTFAAKDSPPNSSSRLLGSGGWPMAAPVSEPRRCSPGPILALTNTSMLPRRRVHFFPLANLQINKPYGVEPCAALPLPSVKAKTASTFGFSKTSVSPLGQRISIQSILLTAPKPKCTRRSLLER